jgi:hypothetical protein
MDGPGPWCEGQPQIPVINVTGDGVYATATGSVQFPIDDKYVFLDDKGAIGGFNGGGSTKLGTIGIGINGNVWTVYYAFETPLAKSLSMDKVNNDLLTAGSNYHATWVKYYSDETCTVINQ